MTENKSSSTTASSENKTDNRILRLICEGAMLLALAVALSFLKVALWAQGGSVDLVMIPLIVFALRWGGGWGIGACVVYGLLDCIFSGGMAYGWQSILLDYFVAYGMVGIAGFFTKKPWLGVVVSSAARLAVHVISGVVIWGQWMPEEFMGLTMDNVWIYSALYNGSFMIPNCIIAVVGIIILWKKTPLLTRQKLKA